MPASLTKNYQYQKLVQRTQAGDFVDMAELFPDRLGINAGRDPQSKVIRTIKKQKRRQVMNILEWIQCYSIYMAVRVKKFPDKVQDMLGYGYQTLIVEARIEYKGDGWLGYDRHFRQTAAASPDTPVYVRQLNHLTGMKQPLLNGRKSLCSYPQLSIGYCLISMNTQ